MSLDRVIRVKSITHLNAAGIRTRDGERWGTRTTYIGRHRFNIKRASAPPR